MEERILEINSTANFLRFQEGPSAGIHELQTSVVRYRRGYSWSTLDPLLEVDLISTVYIADRDYFTALEEKLKEYNLVLSEKLDSRRLTSSGSRRFKSSQCVQSMIALILRLSYQEDCLNYQAQNLYLVDLDYETFKPEKGEGFFTIARDITVRLVKAVQQSTVPEDFFDPWIYSLVGLLWAVRMLSTQHVGLFIIVSARNVEFQADYQEELEALSRLDFSAAMKLFLAKKLLASGGRPWRFLQARWDVEESPVDIDERNDAVMVALTNAVDAGHKKIAILFSASCMLGFGRQLPDKLNSLKPYQVEWITALSITNATSFPIWAWMARVSGWPWNRSQAMALLIFSSTLALQIWLWKLFFSTINHWHYS